MHVCPHCLMFVVTMLWTAPSWIMANLSWFVLIKGRDSGHPWKDGVPGLREWTQYWNGAPTRQVNVAAWVMAACFALWLVSL